MELNLPEADIGVIVGRFQTPELHEAHCELIQYVADRHERLIICLGVGPLPCSPRNPLDFETRRFMIQDRFPKAMCVPVSDCRSDEEWSSRLDELIHALRGTMSAVIYGARDSFIPHYSGKFETRELKSDAEVSATELRERCSKQMMHGKGYRAGVITGAYRRFFSPVPTVDVVPVLRKGDDYLILIVRKPKETQWRFLGGFVDPTDTSLEAAAARELQEEAKFFCQEKDFHYVGSFPIVDWRYRNEPFNVLTTLFWVEVGVGAGIGIAGDDIAECRWVHPAAIKEEEFCPEHLDMLRKVYYLPCLTPATLRA